MDMIEKAILNGATRTRRPYSYFGQMNLNNVYGWLQNVMEDTFMIWW